MKKTKLQYKINLNIKSIVLYEKLTQESFSLFDGTISKIIPLLYCMLVANNDYNESYEDTIKYLFNDERLMKELGERLEKQMKFQSQFKSPFKEEEINLSDKSNDTSNDTKTTFSIFARVRFFLKSAFMTISSLPYRLYG